MNCETAIELLPWYLNGTLEEQEQRDVREHLAGCERCRQALAETRLAWRIYDQHLPTEALVALAWGEKPEGQDPSVVERHLQSCPQCSAELELVRTSRALEEEDGGRVALFPGARRTTETSARPVRSGGWRSAALAAGLAGMVAAGGWLWSANQVQTLEDRLAASAETGRPAVPIPEPVPPTPDPSVAGSPDANRVAEMEAEMETLRQQEERMREQLDRLAASTASSTASSTAGPQINTPIIGLQPMGDVVRGGSGDAEEVPGGGYASLMLTPSHRETHQDHRIEVVDEAGKVVWSAEGLRRSPEGDFSFTLPPGALRPGAYTIRVSAREDGKRVELESYGIRVR